MDRSRGGPAIYSIEDKDFSMLDQISTEQYSAKYEKSRYAIVSVVQTNWGAGVMKGRVLFIGVALAAASSVTVATVFGPTNFGFLGYPAHSCYKPMKPRKPYSMTEEWEVDRYNSEVDSYNSQLRIFQACASEYVDAAQNDMKRIREKVDELLRDVESPY